MKLQLLIRYRTHETINYLTFFLLALLMSGCSGDDDGIPDDTEGDDETAQTGVFIDSEVAGLSYSTPTRSGITNSDGEFKYQEGEVVTFSVGDTEIGKAEASSVMSPVNIASTPKASVGSAEVKNIAAFLQSLDSDNDPSNGITIEASVAEAISVSQIDFTQSITKLLGDIIAEVNEATGSNLVPVYPESAAAHLSESLGDTYESEDLTFEYFIPTVENYISYPRTSVHWVHETDNDGKLVKSYMYERRPYRLIHEFSYLTYNEYDQPKSFDRANYRDGTVIQTVRTTVNYVEDHRVKEFSYHFPADAPATSTEKFIAFDANNRVTEVHYFNHDQVFQVREVFVLDDAGNKLSEIRYDSETGSNEDDILINTQYEYTDAGELKKQSTTNAAGYFVYDYFYRDDLTREKMVRTLVRNGGSEREDIYFYDESEVRNRILITEGDYVSDYISFFENGEPHVVETYYKDFLYEIITFSEDGSSVWKTISEEDNSYKLEYKDADGNISKTEFYDAEGNLLSTQ